MLESIEKKLEKKIEAAFAVPVKTDGFFSFNTFLHMVSRGYGLGVKTRAALYRAGVLRSKVLPCFVISIGNITVGGTGKTPMTLYVADLIEKLGYRVAVVSRGYKGEFEKQGGIVSDGGKIFCSPAQSGDEPHMMATLLKVPVVVGKNRFHAAMTAVNRFKPHVIVLDDAFQHLAVHRDLNLLLMDSFAPFGNRALLPRGPLREPLSAVLRSHAVILTRYRQEHLNRNSGFQGEGSFGPGETVDLQNGNGWAGASVPLFKTAHASSVCQVVDRHGITMDEAAQKNALAGFNSGSGFLVSGIANNGDFRRGCEKLGIKIAGFVEFSDHFCYTAADMESIDRVFQQSKADFFVTTQKDYVKIKEVGCLPAPIVVLGVELVFEKEGEDALKALIQKKIASHGCFEKK